MTMRQSRTVGQIELLFVPNHLASEREQASTDDKCGGVGSWVWLKKCVWHSSTQALEEHSHTERT